jgi:transposase
LKDGRFVFRRENESLNKEAFSAIMRQLKQAACRPGRRVVVITDNSNHHYASRHKAWQLKHAGRFELDFLPPYSPHLNPIERVRELSGVCACIIVASRRWKKSPLPSSPTF